MQIEWGEAEVLKLVGIGTDVAEGPARRGAKWGIGSGAGRTGAERGEPCGVFELWVSDFMRP